jgi:hypothetical protein
MSLPEKVQQLNREIGAAMEHALDQVRQEVSQWLRSSSEEVLGRLAELRPEIPESFVDHEDLSPAVQAAAEELGAKARYGGAAELREALGAIDRARSQADILTALLGEAGRYASRAAVLLLRGGEVRGWSGSGFGDTEAALRELNLGAPREGAWSQAFQGQAPARLTASECALLCSRLEAPLPRSGVLVPLVLRDRVAAALYADRADGEPVTVEALQVLCYTAALAIESLPFRERAATPTLAPVEPLAAEAEPAMPALPAAGEPTDEEPTVDMVVASAAEEPEAAAPETPSAGAAEMEVEIEAEPEAALPPLAETAPWAAVEEPAPYALEAVEEPPVEPAAAWGEPAVEESATPTQQVDLRAIDVEAPAPVEAPAAVEAPLAQVSSPDATVLLQRSNLREVMAPPAPEPVGERPAPPPLRSVPPPPAAPAPVAERTDDTSPSLAGTPEVRPPSDLQGPGWAFASARTPVSPNDEALHEEARRLARLLVSEIKLYNEEQVEEGRRKRDVYERLREDIDRSRQMYEERVEPRILKSTDYFYQELVRILAAGDSKALGI